MASSIKKKREVAEEDLLRRESLFKRVSVAQDCEDMSWRKMQPRDWAAKGENQPRTHHLPQGQPPLSSRSTLEVT